MTYSPIVRLFWVFGVAGLLSACAEPRNTIPNNDIAKVAYQHDGPPEITLFTMVNNSTGAGAHTGLMVNASQRVIFDPAGTLKHRVLLEKDDVIFGITPHILDFYTRAHARKTYHVVIQKRQVTPQIAEQALQMVMNNGPVASAFCANSTSHLLSKIDGFEAIKPTFGPQNLRRQFSQLSGVEETALYEYDDDDKTKALRAYDAQLVVQQRQN